VQVPPTAPKISSLEILLHSLSSGLRHLLAMQETKVRFLPIAPSREHQFPHGFLAQLAEQQPFKLRSLGSNPREPTTRFGSSRWLERLSCKQENVSSIPTQTFCSSRKTVHSTVREARAYGFESRLEYHALIEELAVSPGLEPGVCGFDSRSAHHKRL
jgi:hypothetical protein